MSSGIMVLPGPSLAHGVLYLLWQAQRRVMVARCTKAAAPTVGDLGKTPSVGAAGSST